MQDSDYTHHILSFGWQGNGQNLHPVCSIRNHSDNQLAHLKLTQDYEFNWQLSDYNLCPGYYDDDQTFQPCQDKAVIDDRYDRCKNCDKQDGFRAAFFYGEKPNTKMQNHLDKEHHIYLACFYPDIIKVGTTVSQRRYKRLIEQDALYSMIIASAPGHMIQRLEGEIAEFLGLTRSVQTRRKGGGLFNRLNTQKSDQYLHANLQKLKTNPDLAKYLLPEPEIVDYTKHPDIYYPETQIMSVNRPVNLVGKFLGLRGKQLLVRTKHGDLSHHTTRITNRVFAHLDTEISPSLPDAARQQRLF